MEGKKKKAVNQNSPHNKIKNKGETQTLSNKYCRNLWPADLVYKKCYMKHQAEGIPYRQKHGAAQSSEGQKSNK